MARHTKSLTNSHSSEARTLHRKRFDIWLHGPWISNWSNTHSSIDETRYWWVGIVSFFCKQLWKPFERWNFFKTIQYPSWNTTKGVKRRRWLSQSLQYFLFLLFFLSFQDFLGWYFPLVMLLRFVTWISTIVWVDSSQRLRINISPRSSFKESSEKESTWHVRFDTWHACRVVLWPKYPLQSGAWLTSNFLNLPQLSQEVCRFEDIRAHRSIKDKNSFAHVRKHDDGP